MRRSILTALIILFGMAAAAVAQEETISAPNAMIVELGGRGGLYTLTYERLLSRSSAISAGVMVFPSIMRGSPNFVAIPLSYGFSPVAADSRFFVDAGLTAVLGVDRYRLEALLVPSLGLGFQYRPYTSSGIFKVELLVADVSALGGTAWPWGGIGGGHSF